MTPALRRIVVKGRDGLTRILSTEAPLGGCPGLIAYGTFQRAKLVDVFERYAVYRELEPATDDGA